MKIKYTLNLVFSPLIKLLLIIGRIFGRDRIYWRRDLIDPYLNYSKSWWLKKINIKFADKFLMKEYDEEVFNFAKTLFTFDIKGNIILGEIPKKGKVVIKYNLSETMSSTKIVDVSEISKEMLERFAKESKMKNKIRRLRMFHLKAFSLMDEYFYGEEFKDGIDFEFKIYAGIKEKFISIEKNNYESKTLDNNFRAIWFNPEFEQQYHPTLLTKESFIFEFDVEKIMKRAFLIADEALRVAGHFGRVDILFNSKTEEMSLSEFTVFPSGFFYDRMNKNNRKISYKEKERFIKFMDEEMKRH